MKIQQIGCKIDYRWIFLEGTFSLGDSYMPNALSSLFSPDPKNQNSWYKDEKELRKSNTEKIARDYVVWLWQ